VDRRVVAYVRVSSRAQDDASQRSAIERAAWASGDLVGAWYAEKKSGKTLDRLELARLRADARAGAVHRLYVFKLDRLVRSGVADAFAVVDELRRAGVTLVAVADNLTIRPDREDTTSEVLVFALGLAAKLERAAINDRIAAARERVAAAGGRWGRASTMGRADVAKARAMRDAGKSIRAIAVALKFPRTVVHRALSRKHPPARPPKTPARGARQRGASR